MDDSLCRSFFLQPTAAPQRQYEALRAVFVADGRQKDVAEQFSYSYAAFRQLVSQFRAACAAGQPPPFSPHRDRDARPGQAPTPQLGRTTPPRPTAEPSVSPPVTCVRVSPVSSSSSPCWPAWVSTRSSAEPAIPVPA
jgi:hypothetical protein